MYSYNSLPEALADLKRRGYKEDFNLQAHYLECRSLSIQYEPERFTVDEFYRFEGMSNPDDNSIVFAISSDDGLKGTLVDAYGMYSENLTEGMVKRLHMRK